ncbi:MAG: response regulator [Candidatus Omnitrophica bacterium]|nr:response regulator [Candidatus Omnitrophota bacterium]
MNAAQKPVLVVDDEKEIVDFLEKFISRFGYRVEKVTSGEAALAFIESHGARCVFLDIQMGGVDGIEVLRRIKKTYPDITVIMITGKAEKEVQTKAKRYGAATYITKPLDLEDLSRRIKEYLV